MPTVNTEAAIQHRIVIVPNQSLSVMGLWVFYASIATVTLSLAMWFMLNGYWPVLVFAVAEMLVLGLCLYLCRRQGRYIVKSSL